MFFLILYDKKIIFIYFTKVAQLYAIIILVNHNKRIANIRIKKMIKDYALYIDFVKCHEDNKGFEYLSYSNLSSVRFYYIDDSDGKSEWVRETHFSNSDDVYIDVVDESEVPRNFKMPVYFRLSTAKKSITAYILFNEFRIKAHKKEYYLNLCPDSGSLTLSKFGERCRHSFGNIEDLANHKYSSLKTRFYKVLRLTK